MAPSHHGNGRDLMAGELLAVVDVAGKCLLTTVDGDTRGATNAREELREAAAAAMVAGYSLSEIAAAEATGKERVRDELRGETLKRVEQSAQRVREAEADHRLAIGRAVRLGLSMREVASSAGVTHGTIRAMALRQQQPPTSASPVAAQPSPERDVPGGDP
jgi:hypothetical protein